MSESENKNSLVKVFEGVRGYEKDGVAYLHIEDVARGLGFTETHGEAVCVRWQRLEGYLADLKFSPQVENDRNPHDYYIPENIFYRLCMKAKNAVAEAFQAKVADEIIPSIRKTGSYSVNKPSFEIEDYRERALRWIEEQDEKRRIEAEKQQALANLENEKHGHFHDRMRDNGRCGGYVKNRNHYRTRTTNLVTENAMLRDENTELKDENKVLGRLAEFNPTKTIAQWLRAKKRAFKPFLIPSDSEGRLLFYRAYERYAKWLNGIYVDRPWAKIGNVFYFDTRKQAYVMSWSLVLRINNGEICDVPEAYDLLKYCRF